MTYKTKNELYFLKKYRVLTIPIQ